jgi:4-amino-4-deoxy-L-arabinose transferase-like glycosyltransferase
MGGRRFLLLLALIATVAFVGRGIYIVTVARWEPRPEFTRVALGLHRSFDEYYYSQGANAIAAGNGLRFSPFAGAAKAEQGLHPPLTSILLAPTAGVTGGDETSMRFTVALFGVGVVVLVGLIGRAVAGERAGLLAAGIAAIYPNLWVNDSILLAETFATFFTALTILFTYQLLRRKQMRYAVAAGVACGLAMLSRSELALLVPLLVVPAVLLSSQPWRARAGLAAVACLAAAATVAPLVAYDLTRFDRPVFLSYGSGYVLQGANCDDTYSGSHLGYWNGTCNFPKHETGDASARGAERQRVALRYMRDHIDELPLVVSARIGRLWGVFRPAQTARDNQLEGRPLWVSWAGLVMFFPLVALAIWGVVLLRRRRVALIPLLAPIVIATLTAAAFYGLTRFRVPAEVSLVVLAAVAVDAWLARGESRDGDAPAPAARVEAPTPGGVESGPL